MKAQFKAFALAVSFYTRLPYFYHFAAGDIAYASRFASWVGVLVGAICALVYCLAAPALGQTVAIVFVLTTSVLCTGGFHYDGLADTCDGFWGGWQKERKLAIMKDSMIGTYGVLSLILSLFLQASLLLQIPEQSVPWVLVLIHSLSRGVAGLFPALLTYARVESADNMSKTPQRQSVPDLLHLLILLLPCFILISFQPITLGISLFAGQVLLIIYLKNLFMRHLQGYTGDTLGFAQQLSKLTSLILFVFILSE